MEKFFLVLLFSSGSILFAQQSSKSSLNYSESTSEYALPYTSSQNLNLDIFKLKKTNTISEMINKVDGQKSHPIDNMPIYTPKGKFYLEISPVPEDIDYKLKILSLEKSKYFFRTVG